MMMAFRRGAGMGLTQGAEWDLQHSWGKKRGKRKDQNIGKTPARLATSKLPQEPCARFIRRLITSDEREAEWEILEFIAPPGLLTVKSEFEHSTKSITADSVWPARA